jgi:outer membrane autotransporter protein
LNTGGSDATKMAEQLQPSPSTAGAVSSTVASVGGAAVGVSSSRLASLRTGNAYASTATTGFAAGEGAMAKNIWLKPFANLGNQDDRSGVAGFDSTTGGVAFGIDIEPSDNANIGVALSYAETSVDSDDISNSDADITGYQATLYGGYTTEKWYVEGMLAYASNEVDTTRDLNFGGLALQAKGGHDSDQYIMRFGGGVPIRLGSTSFVTPNASFQWTHVESESFTETGAGTLNLTVTPGDIDVAMVQAGLRFHRVMNLRNSALIPELRVSVLYDLAGDEAISSSIFTGGGAAFTTTGADVAQLGGALGVGVTFLSDSDISFAVNYDADFKEDFLGHSATLQLSLKF